MRDILVTLLVFGSLPFILRNSYIGVLVWSWFGYMNPHRLTWGFAFDMPFAQIVAIVLFISLLSNKEDKKIPSNGLMTLWYAYLAWMIITTIFALNIDRAFTQLLKVYKIQLLTIITIMLFKEQKRIDLLIWVIVVSVGFFSVKGGVFTLLTGGVSRVYGPPGGYIEENNALAIATLMIMPMILYLRHISTRIWVRWGLVLAAVISAISVLGSQSRGALIAISAVALFFWLKTKSKIVSGVAIVLIAVLGWQFMPQSWHDRMDTIENYQEDSSAMGRINAWTYAWNLANDRITGGGLESWSSASFAMYAPDPSKVVSAHSVYFSVLADHGWLGLILFLLILLMAWIYLGQVIRRSKYQRRDSPQEFLARMLQVSLIAFAAGGAFLSLAYYDLIWHIVALAVILRWCDMDKTDTNILKP